MRHPLKSYKPCTVYACACLQTGEKGLLQRPFYESGMIEIGKINILLIGLIGVIAIGLIAKVVKEEGSTDDYRQPVQMQPESAPQATAAPLKALSDTPVAQVLTPKPEVKPSSQQRKKTKESVPFIANTPAPAVQAAPPLQPVQAAPEQPSQNDASRNVIVFNIWSVSELRLRGAYTKLMNDSSVAQVQADARKKDYLNFVNRRTRKCGELDNRFTSNINTVEKLSFHERDVGILKCHTSENITELDRLILSHGLDS